MKSGCIFKSPLKSHILLPSETVDTNLTGIRQAGFLLSAVAAVDSSNVWSREQPTV